MRLVTVCVVVFLFFLALGTPTSLARDALAVGLFVHVWTMRRESQFLPSSYDGDLKKELRQFAGLGVDGMFTDFPDIAADAFRKE